MPENDPVDIETDESYFLDSLHRYFDGNSPLLQANENQKVLQVIKDLDTCPFRLHFHARLLLPELDPVPIAERNHRRAINYGLTSIDPSDALRHFAEEQESRPIFNGRPFDRLGLPVSIFSPTFARVLHDLEDLEARPLNLEILRGTAHLFIVAQELHQTAGALRESTAPVLHKIFGLTEGEIATGYWSFNPHGSGHVESDAVALMPLDDPFSSDRAIAWNESYALMLSEIDIQSMYSYRMHESLSAELQSAGYATCLPCIHVSVAGPYIRFSGSVLTEDLFVHHFTDYLSLCSPGDIQHIRHRVEYISKVFDVMREALQDLRKYYASVQPRTSDDPDSTRLLPNPSYLPGSPQLEGLKFESRLSSGDSGYNPSLWYAQYKGEQVLVKFTERYSVLAHAALVACDPPRAPILYFSGKLLDGTWMIVMELLKGTTAEEAFSGKALPDSVVDDVEAALRELHQKGLVFGDMRRSNIIVLEDSSGTWRGKLIDFDQSGRDSSCSNFQHATSAEEAGPSVYDCFVPVLSSRPTMPCQPMRAEHDLLTLDTIRRECGGFYFR